MSTSFHCLFYVWIQPSDELWGVTRLLLGTLRQLHGLKDESEFRVAIHEEKPFNSHSRRGLWSSQPIIREGFKEDGHEASELVSTDAAGCLGINAEL